MRTGFRILWIKTMANPIIFWIDSFNNRLAGGWNSFVFASKPTFKQGDEVQVILRRIRRPEFSPSSMVEIPFGAATIDFEIGNRAWRPVAGSWYIQHDGNNTELIEYNASAESIENALNSVHSIVVAGGVSVTRINEDGYKVVFAVDGEQTALTGFGEALSPISSVIVNSITLGSVNTKAVFYIYLRQSVVSEVTTVWSSETPVVAVAQELKQDIWDIYLSGQPRDGSFVLSIDDGEPVEVSVFSSPEEVATLVGAGFTVTSVGDYRWRISKDDFTAFTAEVISSANIVSFSGKTANVLLDSMKVAEMLSGITEINTTLQISVTESGKRDTILQTPCMVVGNLSL